MRYLRFCAVVTALAVMAVAALPVAGQAAEKAAVKPAPHAHAGHHAGQGASQDCHPGALCMPAAIVPRATLSGPERTARPIARTRLGGSFTSVHPSFDPPPPRRADETPVHT